MIRENLSLTAIIRMKKKKGPEWMSGAEVGHLDLIDVEEHAYKAVAKDLKPDTTYYYQVGSKSGEKSEIGSLYRYTECLLE